jgi:hypothetical protein
MHAVPLPLSKGALANVRVLSKRCSFPQVTILVQRGMFTTSMSAINGSSADLI